MAIMGFVDCKLFTIFLNCFYPYLACLMSNDNYSDLLMPTPKRSLAGDVAERLRKAIWSGRLAPDERLREELLAEMLGVSRGPIREALSQLEREGLVIKQPN